jgi:REP element-mobilizing transposase RayT
MHVVQPLVPGNYYHIYNRGNNRENLFREERNYRYFLELYAHHVYPVADTFAYCLMPNHFHFLVRIKTEDEVGKTSWVGEDKHLTGLRDLSGVRSPYSPSQHFSNLFNAYTKAVNKAYGRTGALFQRPFGCIEITSERYYTNLIFYIHANPQKHGLIDDFRAWPWSSYHALFANCTTHLCRDVVLGWFGGSVQMEAFHHGAVDERMIAPALEENDA